MVVLSAAICNNEGKAILSRQFLDIPKRKIEGLLLAFFNSLDPTSESNYIETENTRYLYLPIESLYVLLLTSINSNVIEDLNTLTLLGKLIPEYCHAIDEDDIKENVYDLLLAIDEVVTSGHKEKLSLAQIRQITDMDSVEEKIYEAIERNKLNDAKSTSCKRAKEIEKEKKLLKKEKGKNFPMPQSFNIPDPFEADRIYVHEREKEIKTESKETGKSAMKLRKDNQDNHLIKQMEKAGELSLESIKLSSSSSSSSSSKQLQEDLPHKEIHCEVVENIRLFMKSDGRIENFEVNGSLTLHISNPSLGRLRINFHSPSKSQFQFRGHPHLDKQKVNQNIIEMKSSEKSFSINTPVDILKWRFTSSDDTDVPLIINCWPTQTGDIYTVNLEYELTATFLEFNDVQIFIPIPQGNQPVVENNDGAYEFIHKTSTLIWSIPLIDVSNSTGVMEFTVPFSGKSSSFFPIYVNFSSTKTYSQLSIDSVVDITTNQEVDYSRSVSFAPSNYDFKIDY